ncbi:hypothetical protein [Dyella sp. RRB7]|uniref:hypothetical protein n=1 Tax=Dyella sp. RRB7 TaxID=2919502 RepID=UPI001FAA38D4|nr:hypothetical protein [Dyella sp. RRB7]
MSDPKDDPLCLVFIPPLVTLLYRAESTLEQPLTEAQVIAIRDSATCITLPFSVALKGEQERGYPDIVAEQCWEEWQAAREQLFPKEQ